MSTDEKPEAPTSLLGCCNANENDDDPDDSTTAGDSDHLLDQAMTCDALCSLGNHQLLPLAPADTYLSEGDKMCAGAVAACKAKSKLDSLRAAIGSSKGGGGCCAKQLQLPMFLTSKCIIYYLICWSRCLGCSDAFFSHVNRYCRMLK